MKSIYIHIPFCTSRCNYCTFVSSCDYSVVTQYVDMLCDNIVEGSDDIIDSIFFGGGTPSTLDVVHFDKIFDTLYSRHNIAPNAEISVECNPDSITNQLLDCLVGHGVNRISIGLQSANDSTLDIIGRRHSYQQFVNALDMVKQHGIDNINVDIMIGLPESKQQFINTVNAVAKLPIAHVSMYALELYATSKLYSMVENNQCSGVADQDEQADWYDIGRDILAQHGFARYEVSNFAKDTMQCRHNIHYWQCHQYFGYGLSAHGYINNMRYNNTCDMQQYLGGVTIEKSQYIDLQEQMYEYVMLGLRLDNGISMSHFEQLFGVSVLNQYPDINRLVAGQQLCINGDMLYVNNNFTYMLTAILAEIL